MASPPSAAADWAAVGLLGLYVCDRVLKMAAIAHFFRRERFPAPAVWPSVSLIHPVTRAKHDLRSTLDSRFSLRYGAPVEHLFICDAADLDTQAVCRELLASYPNTRAKMLLVAPDSGEIASKVAKLTAALPHATGEVLCFVDDDVALPPDALQVLVPYLFRHGAGAVFGLACYTNWSTPWSSLMSGFVNANALMSYVPLTYLTEPFTITGHCFALRREVFHAVGGLDDMHGRFDDDHELARRVRRLGLRCVQAPLIYDVDNHFDSLRDFSAQITRWSVMPRQAMAPLLSPKEQGVTVLGSAGNLLPALLMLLAVISRQRTPAAGAAASLGLFGAICALCERNYLYRRTPIGRWPLLLIVALVTPWQALAALVSGEGVEWRGQRLRVLKGGAFEVVT